MVGIGRREFITLLGGAPAVWPLAAKAQQRAMPVVGYLYPGSPEPTSHLVAAFRKGLGQTGFVEGRDVAIEYRWADSEFNRLRESAADLVRSRVTVMAIPNGLAALAAKAATRTIPIIFYTGADPVRAGLVASLDRPGGNATGISSMNTELGGKRLGLLYEMLRQRAERFGLLTQSASVRTELRAAAAAIERPLDVFTAGNSREIDAAFASMAQKRLDGLLVDANIPFINSRAQISTLAAHHRLPAIYPWRESAEAGGLMSYGTSLPDLFRQVGIYTGRILKGEQPAELPVLQPTKSEFVINLPTARALGIEVPPTLLAIADEVIE
jgi:putative tryptophan/tyrosine transport system substrate-binding protein